MLTFFARRGKIRKMYKEFEMSQDLHFWFRVQLVLTSRKGQGGRKREKGGGGGGGSCLALSLLPPSLSSPNGSGIAASMTLFSSLNGALSLVMF